MAKEQKARKAEYERVKTYRNKYVTHSKHSSQIESGTDIHINNEENVENKDEEEVNEIFSQHDCL